MVNELSISKFGSLEEFINWTNGCPEHGVRGGWTGCDSYEEAVDIARKGIDLGRAEQQLKELSHSRQEMVLVNDVTGSVVNMDAYLSGEPENMIEFPIVEEPTKFLNLVIDISEPAFVSETAMVNKAIAIASIVDDLENNGYRIAITVGDFTSCNKSFTTGGESSSRGAMVATMVRIKEYHSSLSIGQLIGCIHPSFLRAIVFRHFEGVYKKVNGPQSGIGTTSSMEDIKKVLADHADKGSIYIPNTDTARSLGAPASINTVENASIMINHFINVN